MDRLTIRFEPLDESQFPLIHDWFNQPHVQAFYSLRSWTLEEVRKKLTPYLRGDKKIQGFIIYLDENPLGYIQSCAVKDHPWEDQELPHDIIQEAGSFDLFIGEKKNLRKGLGYQIIECFLERHIWPHYRYCIADPDVRNMASILLFLKCGFKEHKKINSLDALKQSVTLQLFIKERPNYLSQNNMDITQQSITEDLKKQIFVGFSRHAIAMTGYDEKFESVAFVAKDREFAGAVVVELFWGALHIKYVYVEESYRGKGFATRLMEKAFEYGKKNRCPFAFVETMSFQALEFYQKMGFQLEFTRSGYAHGTSFHYLRRDL